jgi:hypothetical protein
MFRFNHHHQGAYYLSLLKLSIIISSYWPSNTPIFIVLTYYMSNMFRLIKSSSGPYIQIQILGYLYLYIGA